MSFFKSIVLAFSMFSALPMPQVEWNEKNMRYMMAAFPLVGVFIAFLCAVCFVLVQFLGNFHKNFSPALISLFFTLIPVLVTGGIHLDGFMDTCDALGSHASLEKRLEILKDSHSGAFAVLGCVIYFLCYFVLSHELFGFFFGAESSRRFVNHFTQLMAFFPLLSIFVLSRLLSAFAVATFPIAKNSGLVHTFASASAKRFTSIWCGFWFILLSIAISFLFGTSGIVIVAASLFVFAAYFFISKKNFGGITGDTAGWFVQISELFSLAAFVIYLIF